MSILSSQNSRVKQVVKLHQAAYREETGLLLVEGLHPIEEALQAGLVFHELFVRSDTPLPFTDPLPLEAQFVPERLMQKMATTASAPPMLAIVERPGKVTLEALLKADQVTLLGMAGLQDPGNVGTLIRSACAFGVSGMVFLGDHVDPYHPKVLRASAGLLFRRRILELSSEESALALLQSDPRLALWGAHPCTGTHYQDIPDTAYKMLLVGSEAHGLPKRLESIIRHVHIPMAAGIDSLNVSVAGAIILADWFQKASRNAQVTKHSL